LLSAEVPIATIINLGLNPGGREDALFPEFGASWASFRVKRKPLTIPRHPMRPTKSEFRIDCQKRFGPARRDSAAKSTTSQGSPIENQQVALTNP
jgi:hypothetical protein